MRALIATALAGISVIGVAAAAPTHQARGQLRVGATVSVGCSITYDGSLDDVQCANAHPVSVDSFEVGGVHYRAYRFANGHIVCARGAAWSWTLVVCPPLPTPTPRPTATPTPRPTATPTPRPTATPTPRPTATPTPRPTATPKPTPHPR